MILAEYIWIDGTSPTPLIRSKTKVLNKGETPPLWPAAVTADPLRGGDNILVLCEVYNTNMTPHSTNTRASCNITQKMLEDEECWYGFEQEYTLMLNGKPLGFPEEGEPSPQGDYYCGAGTNRAFGREIAETHMYHCLQAGLKIGGINAEVCPGQWEFQIGPCGMVESGDHLWLARYILERVGERYGVEISFDGKPAKGDWNGAGCHTNFSTKSMREEYPAVIAAAKSLGRNPEEHIKNYGHGIEERLTGNHETCSYKEFKYGVSDRGASVRIPWQVAKDGMGYIEDRRPNANCDPYVVSKLIAKTVCGV